MGGSAHSVHADDARRSYRKQQGLLLCGSDTCAASCGVDEDRARPLKGERYPSGASPDFSDNPLSCGSDPLAQFDRPKKQNGMKMENGYSNLSDNRDKNGQWNEELILSFKKFDFDAFGAIPHGWVKSLRRPPDAFTDFFGSALVIEPETQDLIDTEDKPKEMRVLLALPEAHVDLQRAKWLSRRPAFTAEARYLSHVCRIRECKAVGQVVFEFNYPRGEPLSERLKQGRYLPLDKAQLLMYRLLTLVTTATMEPLRLCGFLDPSMVYLDNSDNLEALLPLGTLLTFIGVKATMLQVIQAGREWAVAPEVKCAVLTLDTEKLTDMDSAIITDSYAVALLVIRAFGQEFFDRNKGLQVELPALARDLILKVLHHESEWRLSGQGALDHPWMQEIAQKVGDE